MLAPKNEEEITEDETESQSQPDPDPIVFREFKKIKGKLRQSIEENKKLKDCIKHLQKQINELKVNQRSELDGQKDSKESKSNSISMDEFETDEEELARETEWIRVKHRKTKTLYKENDRQQKEKAIEKEKPRKTQLPPPIIVERFNSYDQLYSIITSEISMNKFQVKLISENSAKINAVDSDSYRAIVDKLNSENHTFHTYENKQTRPIRVMIKDLHHTCNPESIVANLQEQGFGVIEAINKQSYKKKTALNMFMVTFENSESIDSPMQELPSFWPH